MELSKYIEIILANTKAQEVVLDLKLNDYCEVDAKGMHKIKLKLVRK